MIEIVTYDGVSPVLERISAQTARPRSLMATLGKTLESELRAHFAKRQQQPNRKRWPKRNFWSREGREKTALIRVGDDEAVVAISSPAIAHKITGGTIRAKRGGALAIPVRPEAYQQGSPRNWEGPSLFRPLGTKVLATVEGEELKVQYVLVPSVTHQPDPDALPDRSAVTEKLMTRTEAWMKRMVRAARKGGAE